MNQIILNTKQKYLCDYADAYILVTGIIRTVGGDNSTKVPLKIMHHLENAFYI